MPLSTENEEKFFVKKKSFSVRFFASKLCSYNMLVQLSLTEICNDIKLM